jgi:hypothetical protein
MDHMVALLFEVLFLYFGDLLQTINFIPVVCLVYRSFRVGHCAPASPSTLVSSQLISLPGTFLSLCRVRKGYARPVNKLKLG